MPKKAIILLSGGLDSSTVLAVAKSEGYECYCLSFRYGQKHLFEIESAKNLAKIYDAVVHKIIDIDLTVFDGSSLTSALEVPKHTDLNHLKSGQIPSTYVHGRNTIFLSYAFAYAEALNISNLFIGCNAIDYGNYPDCRPEYISTYEKMINLAKARIQREIKIYAPLLHLSKSEIIILGKSLGVDYSLTTSCYNPYESGQPCSQCDACLLRVEGFTKAGLSDPLHYI
ncbi:MAG: 7-cyano-7-deazaguanine synthase QueC [Candidatus Midichloria sp.]|nr:7-cyano-7-deazaguanine synthase QueC [Candidatus Midichloria sp.]